mgnify:CR=1 FL=1
MDFSKFKIAVAGQFEKMRPHQLFRTGVAKDALWDAYLAAFPPGTNPIYRARTEYDCNCCKSFIRAVGNVVVIFEGKLVSIWGGPIGDPTYQAVADQMSALVKSKPIENIFLHSERHAGTDKTFEQATEKVVTWNHFFVNLPDGVVVDKDLAGPRLGEARAIHDVLARGLTEISAEAIQTVLELIAQNSLYRGEENRFVVASFDQVRSVFYLVAEQDRDAFIWSRATALPVAVSKIRNTAIGTLLVDLSGGMDIDQAVKSFEAKVAPTNYKRPSAVVTKGMVDAAKKQVDVLGLTSALERRYATLQDLTINNVLHANRSARPAMGATVFDAIAAQIPDRTPTLDRVEEVPIEKFVADILPKAQEIEIMFENQHSGNLVSLIAPQDPTAGMMFKWPNRFSWSYQGDLADSMKERVKQAGGAVAGDLCCRLGWFNFDDLDFHMREPGYEIFYRNKGQRSPSGGALDVDMNAGHGTTRQAVENIYYQSKEPMRDGTYVLQVHQFCQREAVDIGFEVEMDFMGAVHRFAYDRVVRQGELVPVAEFKYSKKDGLQILQSLPSTQAVKTHWGIQTQKFHRVNVLLQSPNCWDGHQVGNRHWFFMLDGCVNDGSARGFFNEFLKEDLTPHRKVIEIVGAKMRAAVSADQLSGLGFSSTQRASLLCCVSSAFTRTIKIVF